MKMLLISLFLFVINQALGQSENTYVEEEIFKVKFEKPRFPNCENLATLEEKLICSDKKLNEFIRKNIKYPVKAGVAGTVIASFRIKTDGSITDIKLIKKLSICKACNDEVIRVLKLMPRWTPAKSRGRPYRLKYIIPIRFELEEL